MGKKIIAGIITMIMICSMIPIGWGMTSVKGENVLEARVDDGLLKWNVYSGANQYQVIIMTMEGKSIASEQKSAYAFEEVDHQNCSFDVMAKLQEKGEYQEGLYGAYVVAIKNGQPPEQSNTVTFAFIPHIHQWDIRYQWDEQAHWKNCTENHCYIGRNEQKMGYGAHTFSSVIVQAPSLTKEGVQKDTCTVCGYSRTIKIPKLIEKKEQSQRVILASTIRTLTGNKEAPMSGFSPLCASAKKVGKSDVTLTWKKVPGAANYVVFKSGCGKKDQYEELDFISGNRYKVTKLKKGTNYKFLIVAVAKGQNSNERVLGVSKVVHCITGGSKTFSNYSKIKVSKKKVVVRLKKSVTIQAKPVAPKKKKVSVRRKVLFESGNPKVATVNAKGKIVGKKKGKCVVYAYAQNGIFAKVTVIVK